MAVSGTAPGSAAFGRFQALMKDLHTSVQQRDGKNLTGSQADRIVGELNQLQDNEKLAAREALKAFLRNDAFSVTDAARESFAAALGVDAATLKPQASASGVKRSIAKLGLEIAAGATKVDAAQLKELFSKLKDTPKEVGDFVTHAVKTGSEDGDIKMSEPEGRKEFVKEVAQRNSSGKLDDLGGRFGDDFAKRVPPYLLDMMSSPPLFEEIIFILMITLVSTTQGEIVDDQARIQQAVDGDTRRANEKEARQKSIQAGLQKKAEAGTTTPKGPEVDAATMSAEKHRLARTKRKLEGFVQAVDASLRDNGKIDANESQALVQKLERSFKEGHPARELLGQAIGTAITHTNVGERRNIPEQLKPFLEWAQNVTGLEKFPAPTPSDAKTPLADRLMGSDRIEQRLAGFLVDSFFQGKALRGDARDTVARMQPVVQEIVGGLPPGENLAAQAAQGLEGAAPKSEGGQVEAKVLARFQRLMEENDRIKAESGGHLELDVDAGLAKAIERAMPNATPEEKAAVGNAVKQAFASLPPGRPASEADVRQSYAAARDSLVSSVVDKDPEVQKAIRDLVDSSMAEGISQANGKIKNIEEGGRKKLTKEQKAAVLDEFLAARRHDVVQTGLENGLGRAEAEALGTVFDKGADALRARFARTGKMEPENTNGAGMEATDPAETNDTRSRQIMFEQLKFKMNMLSEMMQSMSNILNTMHSNAETTIRAIR